MKFIKIKFLIFISLVSAITSYSQNLHKGILLAQVQKNGKFGYINMRGKEIVPVAFDEVGNFHEGYTWVRKGEKYGLYNKQGKLVISIQYRYLDNMSCGLILAKNEKGKIGYLNARGEIIIDFQFDKAEGFHAGLAKIYRNGAKYDQIINRKGEIVYDNNKEKYPHTIEFKNFSEERALFLVKPYNNGGDSYYGYLDNTGKIIVPPVYSTSVIDYGRSSSLNDIQFHQGRAAVGKHFNIAGSRWTLWGYIDTSGKQVIDYKYFEARAFNNWNFAFVADTSARSSYINLKEEFIFPFGKYKVGFNGFGGGQSGNFFLDGFIPVTQGSKSGLINSKGEEIIPLKEWHIRYPDGENYIVTKKENGIYKYAIYNSKGELVQDFTIYSSRFNIDPAMSEGIISYRDTLSQKNGYKDKKYETIIEPRFDYASSFKNGMALVKEKGKKEYPILNTYRNETLVSGYIDKSGNYLFSQYNFVQEFIDVDQTSPEKYLDTLQFSSEDIHKVLLQNEYSGE